MTGDPFNEAGSACDLLSHVECACVVSNLTKEGFSPLNLVDYFVQRDLKSNNYPVFHKKKENKKEKYEKRSCNLSSITLFSSLLSHY